MPLHPAPRAVQQGFTLIELIVVVILLGILAVTASSRLIGRSSFDAIVVRDQAIALARQIQREGMDVVNNPQTPTYCVALQIRPDKFGAPACSGAHSATRFLIAERDQVSFRVSQPARQSMTLFFDWLGRPMTVETNPFQRACTPNRCEIAITAKNGEQAMLCINAEGLINDCAI
ncbi:prepilin-type N-terminal cleavage/methylation domain-containing protein [Photobacterium japonica]|uniref:type II secretion system protein n=1 Tax=Photobacterium japonica TaxID=2910235 RepID=UPI003D12221C